jgi:Calcineurin-like phosphoesterase
MSGKALFAVSDLHVDHPENRKLVEQMRPRTEGDWLIVCGDVADRLSEIESSLRLLADRFERVIWAPGNHDLLTYPDDASGLVGEGRYCRLVEICRDLGVVTPEDPYLVWEGPGGPARVAPLFLLYDYSFGRNVGTSKRESLRRAYAAGVVCVDEFLLKPDPYPSREAWCEARLEATARRLAEERVGLPTILVNHFPLVIEPTRVLHHPEFAQWCGTIHTADWHRRFEAVAAVYGHLHIPRTTYYDGVRFEEVSLGYPRERQRRADSSYRPRQILPEARRA